MSKINLEEFTEFGKIKDIYDSLHDREGLFEFVNNVVMNKDMFDENNKNGYGNMLKDLSNIYVLVSNKMFPFNKLNSKQRVTIDLKKTKKNFVLGYIWLCPWKIKNEGVVPLQFISFIDSRISGLNIAKYMIEKYEEGDEYNATDDEVGFLLPFEITMGAEKYWKKYFTEVYDIKNKKELEQIITDYKFKETDIRWSELMSVF